jgi:hypothetical protein
MRKTGHKRKRYVPGFRLKEKTEHIKKRYVLGYRVKEKNGAHKEEICSRL